MFTRMSSKMLISGAVCLACMLHAGAEEPPEAASHWQTGQVCMDGKWLTRQQVAEIAGQDKRLAEYRKLRERSPMTVEDQTALAKWCKKNKLPDEERVHWLSVLQLQPGNAEAVKGLGLHPYQGILLTSAADRPVQVRGAGVQEGHGALAGGGRTVVQGDREARST